MQKQNEQKFWSKLQLPKRKVNEDEPFLFEVYDWRTDGMIFIFTALLIPLIALFIFRFALGMGTSHYVLGMGEGKNRVDISTMLYLVITLISNGVGLFIFWQRDKEILISSGFFVFYAFIFIQNIVALIVGIILSLAKVTSDGQPEAFQLVMLWTQIIAEVIVLFLALKHTTGLWDRIKQTIKENWLMLIIVVLIVGGLMFVVSNIVYQQIFKSVEPMVSSSENQKTLEDGLKNGSVGFKVAYGISLFILTILIAPLTEELATRNAIFSGVGNKALAIITASLYFGMMHVQAGDVEHILQYIIGGLFLAGIFTIARGNVTYDTGSHMLYNLINFIIIMVQISKGVNN